MLRKAPPASAGRTENVLTPERTERPVIEPNRPCDLPGCHAGAAGRGRRYCCEDHTRAGRNLANIRSRAVIAERQDLLDALDGKAPPPVHVGFLATATGVVLTGQALIELRAAVSVLRSAAALADGRTTTAFGRPQFLGRLREVRIAAENAAAAVERVLPGR